LAKLSGAGRVVIPAEVRKHLELSQGSALRFWLGDSSVRLLEGAADVRRLKGRLTAPTTPVSVGDMTRAVAEQRGGSGGAR
jgi:AbrB family looped-hinge helix DNA binding protein